MAVNAQALAQGPITIEHKATLATLFTADEAAALSQTLPADREVRFRVRLPSGDAAAGVIVFISADDSGELPIAWAPVLDSRQLLWIAADGYGNSRPTAERMLAAVMAMKLAGRLREIDAKRQFVSGMSGGGRVASQAITHFPQLFTGAIYIVGADYWMPGQPLRGLALSRSYVFVTGSRDFNRREMSQVFARYQKAGVMRAHLMDLPGFGHERPDADLFARALDLLEVH